MKDDFIVLNVEEESPDRGVFDKKMPWDKRARLIEEMFPSTAKLDWKEVFRLDPTVFGKVIADIAKHEQKSTGKPGKRPSVKPEDAAQYLRRYQDDDYTTLEFKDIFKILKAERSIRNMGHKCGITETMTARLLDGRARPTAEIMEKVARAFKKHPSFFVEYRIAFVVATLVNKMQDIPEASIVPYLKLRGSAEREWR